MAKYKLNKPPGESTETSVTLDLGGGVYTCIPFDPANTDYQEYLAWVAAGNTAEAAD